MSVFQKLYLTFAIILAVGWLLMAAGKRGGSEEGEQLGACVVVLSFLGIICSVIWWVRS